MQVTTIKQKLLTYLIPALFATLKVGCCIEHKLRRFLRPIQREGEDVHLAAANDQAELVRWHYRLGHLTFAKLKQLALNGEIPKKLTTVTPPKCAGCLFGTMTKIPWRDKETKASHEVFIATKPGECISVDQMTSTEVGFFMQLKGKLTKRRYRCATIFVNHFSRLRFVHLKIDDSSAETLAAKRTFETFPAEHGVRICYAFYPKF